MLVQRVDAKNDELQDPTGAAWRGTRASNVVLSPTPLDIQPTDYVRVSWKGRPYGKAPSMRVSALHNGRKIFFRLVWDDDSADGKIGDIDQFVDSAAVLFPIAPDAPLIGMGIKGKPVNAWFWRADWERPKNVSAEGMGSTQRRDDPALSSKQKHARGRWDLVISRSFSAKGAPDGTIALSPGESSKVAFAIWQGANRERAGVKAFSLDWQDLEIER
jgi:ethylbenzene hydroxylase subunit gamma/complex iron-sulfur molybdoenzyme family reductase subunit gamma